MGQKALIRLVNRNKPPGKASLAFMDSLGADPVRDKTMFYKLKYDLRIIAMRFLNNQTYEVKWSKFNKQVIEDLPIFRGDTVQRLRHAGRYITAIVLKMKSVSKTKKVVAKRRKIAQSDEDELERDHDMEGVGGSKAEEGNSDEIRMDEDGSDDDSTDEDKESTKEKPIASARDAVYSQSDEYKSEEEKIDEGAIPSPLEDVDDGETEEGSSADISMNEDEHHQMDSGAPTFATEPRANEVLKFLSRSSAPLSHLIPLFLSLGINSTIRINAVKNQWPLTTLLAGLVAKGDIDVFEGVTLFLLFTDAI